MWARRIAALALAIGLVVAAFVVRDRRSSSGATAGPDTSSGPTTPGGPASNPANGFTLVCVTELRAACQGAALGDKVTVRIEAAGTTASALTAAADPGTVADAWLTVDPWPAIVDQRRSAAGSPGLFGPGAPLVAHSPVGVAVRKQRDTVLAGACGGTITLACAVDKGGAAWASLAGGSVTWQKVRPSVSDPAQSGTGLAALTAAVREQRQDSGLTLGELDADTAFGSWLARIERSDFAKGSPLAQSIGVPQFDVVLVPRAEFESTAGAANDFVFVGGSRHETAVALATRAGATAPKGLADTLATRLQQSGWIVGAPTVASLDANLMAGIQQLWKDRRS
jgi:Bacterial extracellular solute-binding protein